MISERKGRWRDASVAFFSLAGGAFFVHFSVFREGFLCILAYFAK